MGYGDEIIGSGFAKGLAAQGKRLALGDGQQIRWTSRAHEIFRNNPNVAPPGSEGAPDLVWKAHYAGNRCYNRQAEGRWEWIKQPDNGIVPGEIFFDRNELVWSKMKACVPGAVSDRLIIIEPNIPAFKAIKGNKSWPAERYDHVAKVLGRAGYHLTQITLRRPYGPGHEIRTAQKIPQPPDMRHSLALLARARLYIGPEGGMHHAAAALGIPAVVIFGGFISPEVTGYSTHRNLFKGGEACGSFADCEHCRQALLAISTDEVVENALDILRKE